jgi:hypothetical protein
VQGKASAGVGCQGLTLVFSFLLDNQTTQYHVGAVSFEQPVCKCQHAPCWKLEYALCWRSDLPTCFCRHIIASIGPSDGGRTVPLPLWTAPAFGRLSREPGELECRKRVGHAVVRWRCVECRCRAANRVSLLPSMLHAAWNLSPVFEDIQRLKTVVVRGPGLCCADGAQSWSTNMWCVPRTAPQLGSPAAISPSASQPMKPMPGYQAA